MKSFDFDLQRVLDIRNLWEEMAENNLLQAHRQVKKTEDKLDTVEARKRKIYNYLREQELSVDKLLQSRNYLQIQRQEIRELKEELRLQKEDVAEKKKELLSKKKDRQVLDKLKEKEYRNYYKDILRKEQKTLDEIGQRMIEGQVAE